MSKIEVDQVDPQSGTTLTLGTSGDTISIPSGVTLANAGTATGFAAIDWQSTIVTGATHTASANQGIWINTTSNACNLTLPGSPSVGDQLIFSDFARTWDSNAVTLTLNGSKYQGNTTPVPVYDTKGETVHIVYSGSTQGWIPINDGAVALETPQSYSIDFLVVAGGGGGGYNNAGGGGGGGMRTSTQTSDTGVTITATVGGGGNGETSPAGGASANGVNSSISGTGLTTITSNGGGAGKAGGGNGNNGGSGGGGGYASGAGGSGNTPSTTPSQGADGGDGLNAAPGYAGGGGGGGGASGTVGANATGSTAGNGGNGTQSSITGVATYYAGGGGGAGDQVGIYGTGGSGGGGNGFHSGGGTDAQCDGTDGLGGGGGAHYNGPTRAGNGGSGVIIISVPDALYSGTTTGSPTVATNVGGTGKTTIKFTGSGTYVT
jgi:hypothetical protein